MINLTIIIPHFNTFDYLKRLLDSIPDSENIQTLVVDDKSTVGLEKYHALKEQYKHVTFFDNKTEEKGAGVCRNIGLQHAMGKWVLFADADDYFVQGFYDIIKKYFLSGYDAVFFTPTSADAETGQLSNRHERMKKLIYNYNSLHDRNSELKLRYTFNEPWSKLIARKCIKENHLTFDATLVANDAMFSTKLAYYAKSIFASENVIYCVTRSLGSLITKVDEKHFFIRLNVFVNKDKFLREHLSEKDFSLLEHSGARFIYLYAIEQKQSIRTIIRALLFLKKNKVKIFRKEWYNLFDLLRLVKKRYKNHKIDRQYYTK